MEVGHKNIIKLCRICLYNCEKRVFVNIFTTKLKDNDDVLLCDAVTNLTGIKVAETDGFPQRMCFKCENKFNIAYNLIQQTTISLSNLIALKKLYKKTNKQKGTKGVDEEGTDAAKESDANEDEEEEEDEENDEEDVENEEEDVEEEEDEDEDDDDDDMVGNITLRSVIKQEPGVQGRSKRIKLENLSNVDDDNNDDAVSFLTGIIKDAKPTTKLKALKETRKQYNCQVCNKNFVGKSNLVDHLRLHANVRNFKCEYCDKTFVQSGNYKSHLRTHTNERPYKCNICTKRYNHSGALKIHIRTHTNEKNYACDVCFKKFTNSSDMGKHKRIHDDVKKFKCTSPGCDKSFAQKNHLKNHEKIYHSNKDGDTSASSTTTTAVEPVKSVKKEKNDKLSKIAA